MARIQQALEACKSMNWLTPWWSDFGAFVQIMPGKDGLVHVSEMSEERVAKPSDAVKEGDLVITMGAGDIYKTGEELVELLNK